MINSSRPPDLYLPIDTSFWEPGIIQRPTDTLEVWAMSYYDEILLKNPDGLMNGRSIENIIKRCIPEIINPLRLPESSYRYIVIGLTLATTGNKTTIRSICEKCKEENAYDLDLQQFLDDYNRNFINEFDVENLKFTVGEATYRDIVDYRNNNYGLLKSITSIKKKPESSFNIKQLRDQLNKYRKNEIWLKSKRIKKIEADGIPPIDTPADITNLLENFNKNILAQIDNHFQIYQLEKIKDLKCNECGHVNKVTINLDPSDQFFKQLVSTDDNDLEDLFTRLENDVKVIRKEIARLVWFMRGSVSYDQCMHMSPGERSSLDEVIKENIDIMKKTKNQVQLL